MDRSGTRLMNLFQMLEKLVPNRESSAGGASIGGRYNTDDVQQLRYLSSKILQYVTSQDKEHRELVLKNTDYIDCLLRVLEISSDKFVSLNVVYIIVEIVIRINSTKRLSVLVSRGATQVLLHLLVCEAKSDDCSNEFLVTIHQLLTKLGPRDRKFGVKARLYQALGVSLNLVRVYTNTPKALQSVIHVVKLYAADVVNACYLGKNGLVTYLFKIFTLCQRKHLILLKYAIDTLALLVKSKSNAARAVGHGGVVFMLNMFTDWHKTDTKNRHVNIRKSILNVLKNFTEIKSGRTALMEADGIRVLYSTCQETVDCRELESIISLANTIMRKCFPKNRLPVPTLRSPLSFSLPDSDAYESATQLNEDENEYESSLDNDDDISSDEDNDGRRMDSDDDMDASVLNDTSYKRSWDDLCMYKQFFAELFEFDPILQDADPSFRPMTGPAMTTVPTTAANLQSLLLSQAVNGPQLRLSQSYGVIQTADPPPQVNTNGSSPCLQRRLSLNTLKASSNQRLIAGPGCSSSLLVDGTGNGCSRIPSIGIAEGYSELSHQKILIEPSNQAAQLAPPPANVAGRSPKVRRKTTGKQGKSKEKKKSSAVKQTKGKAEELPKYDFNSVLTALASSVSGSDGATGGVRNQYPTCDVKIEDVSGDEDGVPVTGIFQQQVHPDPVGEFASQRVENPELYGRLAAATKSVGRFNKLAYPDLYGHLVTPFKEPFYEKKFGTQRSRILQDIDRFINPDQIINRVVYDLDAILGVLSPSDCNDDSFLDNADENKIRSREVTSDCLEFNSQFESGNLRKAIQVRKYEYDLILNPDINVNHHHQWFYFEVSNMDAGIPYRFNIINCEKVNSQFNFGMRPVMFSVSEASQGRPYWYRVGTKLCYYKNHFVRSTQTTGGVRGKTYYTATFTVTFKQDRDVCYIAYHYPYTYTMLQYHLRQLETEYDSGSIYYRNQSLCDTVSGNSVPLLTITSHPLSYDKEGIDQLKSRPYIFLSSRVHPGESNASWVMKGTLELLLSDRPVAKTLRDMFIFKVVPMLNPDGVINGHHRCSLTGEDLNRRWFKPCPKRHPTIYHTKGLMQFIHMALGRGPLVFCDYHGHSRRKNVFMYGCSPFSSWVTDDDDNPTLLCKGVEDPGYKLLPKLLHQSAPAFSLNSCNFVVEKVKETTARVVVWRQLGVVRSYTMESSYCGCDQGPYKGQHINTQQLEEMGCKFAEALVKVRSRTTRVTGTSSSGILLTVPISGYIDDEFDVTGSLIDVSQLAADDGSSSFASGALSDRDDPTSDVPDNDIENDLEVPLDDDIV